MHYNYTIGIYAHGVPFVGSDYHTKPLGGSESSAILLAESLADLGNQVIVFSHGDEETYGDKEVIEHNKVKYFRLPDMWERANSVFEWDIFLVERDYKILTNRNLRTRQLGFLAHDILVDEGSFMEHAYPLDFMYCLSEFHKQQFVNKCKELKNKIQVLGNPIDTHILKSIKESVANEKFERPTFVYNSRPERGLLLLLKYIWPEILHMYPDAELKVCFYPVDKENLPGDIQLIHNIAFNLMKVLPNVDYMGGLPKKELYELVAQSHAVLYSSIFPESYNISAIESQILGTPYLTTNMFAMRETVYNKSHLIFDYKQLNEAFHAAMTRGTWSESLLTTKAKTLITQAVENTINMTGASNYLEKKYNKLTIAREFQANAQEHFKKRYTTKGIRIVHNLIYHSDYIAAKYALTHFVKDEKLETMLDSMLQMHHTNPERYAGLVDIEQKTITKMPDRMFVAMQRIKQFVGTKYFTLTDIGTGGGRWLYNIKEEFRDQVDFQGLDFSKQLVDRTKELLHKHFHIDPNEDYLYYGDFYDIEVREQSDVVFCGEFMEHQQTLVPALEQIRKWCKPGGLIVLTMPYGPLESLSNPLYHHPDHVQHFEQRDIEEIFADQDFTMEITQLQRSPIDDVLLAQWVICIKVGKELKPFYNPNYKRKFETTRPYVKLGLSAIAKDEEENVHRFLKPFLQRVDHVVVYVNNSNDNTEELCLDVLGRENTENCIERDQEEHNIKSSIPPKNDHLVVNGYWDDDFSAVRNRSLNYLLAYDVDWVLWGDFDEKIIYPHQIKKYIRQGDLELYNGFILYQQHLTADIQNNNADIPVRLFRAERGYKFFGLIHEHGMLSLNEPIEPVMIVPEVKFLHYGYTTEIERRRKAINRNFALLEKDRQVNPHRQLGAILYMRDLWNLVSWQLESNPDNLTDKSIDHLNKILTMYKQFSTPDHMYHSLADTFYQDTLKIFGEREMATQSGRVPIQVAIALAGKPGALQSQYAPQLRWFMTPQEVQSYIQFQTRQLVDSLKYTQDYFSWK